MPRSLIRYARAWLADHGNVLSATSIWVGLTSLAATVVRPLWGALPKGHDTLLHLYRIAQINALWRQGVLFSRWSPDLVLGYGYPLFNFYPPLSAYLLTLIYWLIGQNAPAAMSALMAASLLLACLGMYRLGRALYGASGGLFAAAAYTLSPYLLYQVFERSSISNALAMGLFPWAAWALLRAASAPAARRIAWAAIPIAGVLISHVAASLLFMAPLALWGLAAAWGGERRHRPVFVRGGAVALALTGGLMLAAFFWLPASAEYPFTRYGAAIASPDVDLRLNFVQLVAWPGMVVSGVTNPSLPMTTGATQLALGSAALIVALAGLRARWKERQTRRLSSELLTAVSALCGLMLAFMSTPLSLPIWEHVALLRNVQWPWRCLDVATFFLALACGRLTQGSMACREGANQQGKRRWQLSWRPLLLVAAIGVMFANAVPYMYPPRWQSLPARPTLADATAVQVQWGIYGLTSWSEYLPATARLSPEELPNPGIGEGATLDAKLRRGDLPAGALRESSGGPLWAELRLSLDRSTTLTWDTFFFPGWRAWVDGQPVEFTPDADGRLSLGLAPGEHTVTARYGQTAVQSLADALTLFAALLIVAALVFGRRFSLAAPAESTPACAPRPALVLLGVTLVALTIVKFAWLDRADSPLVHYLRNGQIQGVEAATWQDFGAELRLVGYRLESPGHLALYWQAQRVPSADFHTLVILDDTRGATQATLENSHPGYTLASRWEAGQLVRDEFTLPLDEAQRPIGYRLRAAVLNPITGERLPLLDSPEAAARELAIGSVKLAPVSVSPAADERKVGVTFGGIITLVSARFPETTPAGAALDLSLLWKAAAVTETDYTVFIHLLNADGTLAAGQDAQPRQGLYPTSFWDRGETILDERHWQPALPPGEYRLEVGLYDLATGKRLLISQPGAPPADHLILGTIRVTE